MSARKIISENASPSPIETIITSGNQLDGKGEKNTDKVAKDSDKIYALAQAFTATQQPDFLNTAQQWLLAWANTNKASADAIANTNLEKMILAYIMLKPHLIDNSVVIENWLNSIAAEMIKFHNSKTPNPKRHDGLETIFNNHNSHFLKTILLIGYATNNRDYVNYVKSEFPAQINRSFANADGSGIDFEARDSIRYHAYSLQELLKIGRLLSEHGDIDYNPYTLVTESGASLKRAVQFLIPFSITGAGAKQHTEYTNSLNIDKNTGENRDVKRNGTPEYDPKYSIPVFENAVYFDAGIEIKAVKYSFKHLITSINTDTANLP